MIKVLTNTQIIDQIEDSSVVPYALDIFKFYVHVVRQFSTHWVENNLNENIYLPSIQLV